MERGKIIAQFSVRCGRCACHLALFGAMSRRQAAERARQRGWTLTRAWGWMCCSCREMVTWKQEGM